MKFSAGITLFNPNKEQINRVFELAKYFDCIYLFDNTENIDNSHFFIGDNRIQYYSVHENMGLPYAFNYIFKKVKAENVDFICTLDQDSLFTGEDIENIKNKIAKDVDVKKVAIVAPFIDYGASKYTLSDELLNRRWVITSGSFVNLNLVKNNSIYYDENYFIDKFEIDFCENLIRHGFIVHMYMGSVLHQELGEKGRFKGHPNHSPLRHYYLFRNRYYFNKKWHRDPKRFILNFLQTMRHLAQIILYENLKMAKIKALFRAKRDFKKNKMGRINV